VALSVVVAGVLVGAGVCTVVCAAACADRAPPPPPPPSASAKTTTVGLPGTSVASSAPLVVTEEARAQALRGEFPAGPEVDVLLGRCAICHSTQYLTMQRLTPAQWEKTLKKMKGWGAPIDDAEIAALQRYLGAYFTPALPAPALAVVAPPDGAVP
jgi:hypothetical protein